jgi:predicted Rdx family selenoprotein
VFDVVAGDTVIFSKYDEGRFPEAGELVASIRRLQ